MRNAMNIIGDNIAVWWDFLFSTYVPSTNFTFGGLYLFILFFSIFIGVLSLIVRKDDSKK